MDDGLAEIYLSDQEPTENDILVSLAGEIHSIVCLCVCVAGSYSQISGGSQVHSSSTGISTEEQGSTGKQHLISGGRGLYKRHNYAADVRGCG